MKDSVVCLMRVSAGQGSSEDHTPVLGHACHQIHMMHEVGRQHSAGTPLTFWDLSSHYRLCEVLECSHLGFQHCLLPGSAAGSAFRRAWPKTEHSRRLLAACLLSVQHHA